MAGNFNYLDLFSVQQTRMCSKAALENALSIPLVSKLVVG